MPKKATGGAAQRTTGTKRRTARAKTAAPTRPQRQRREGPALRVKQVRSGIGHAATYRRTLRALGLKHHQDEVVVADTPAMRGMLHKVRHLVRVTPEEA